MRINEIELYEKSITGNKEGIGVVVSCTDLYEFENGKKTDKQIGFVLETVMPDNRYNKEKIKVVNTNPVVTNELIAQQGGTVKVKFKNLRGKFYRTPSGEYLLSCKADGVEVMA